MKIIVNAIPLINIHTGISRYLSCLYTALEQQYGNQTEIGYFDGKTISNKFPPGPKNQKSWSQLVDIFWKLPPFMAFQLRQFIHLRREAIFKNLSREFDIYHEAGFFPFKTHAKVKVVFTVHDLSIFRYPECHPKERVLFFEKNFQKSLLGVDHFLTVSDFTKSEMIAYCKTPASRLTTTPLAFDPDVFHPQLTSSATTVNKHAKHRIPEKYFLYIGSGDPRKNMEVIPSALEQAELNIPLVTAGWSGWSDKLINNNIISLGYVTDQELAELYAGAIALILPSRYEGFGLPVLEAMACGCPVITSQAASLPEVAGDAAIYLKDPTNRKELATVLTLLTEQGQLRTAMSEQGELQASKFSWFETARLTYQVFREIL